MTTVDSVFGVSARTDIENAVVGMSEGWKKSSRLRVVDPAKGTISQAAEI